MELDHKLYEKAQRKFKNPNVQIMFGNSAYKIPKKADLYWLDSHPATMSSIEGCPLMKELERIEDFNTILIDDADSMGKKPFPSLIDICAYAEKKKYRIKVRNNIIIIQKRGDV